MLPIGVGCLVVGVVALALVRPRAYVRGVALWIIGLLVFAWQLDLSIVGWNEGIVRVLLVLGVVICVAVFILAGIVYAE